MPMLDARRYPDDVAGPDFLDRAAPVLAQADARRDDQRLAERMRVPGGARARLERHDAAADPGRSGRLEPGIDTHGAGEVIG